MKDKSREITDKNKSRKETAVEAGRHGAKLFSTGYIQNPYFQSPVSQLWKPTRFVGSGKYTYLYMQGVLKNATLLASDKKWL